MLGLFTTKAYAEPASQTPLLHRKLRQILRSEDLIEGSHDYKAAVSLFDSFPKDELFAASTDDLRGAVVALLALQGEQVRLLGRRDPDGRSASLIVALPRSRYDAELLARLQDLLPRALRDRRGRLPPRARRGRPRAGPLPRPRLRGAARRRLPRARARGRRGHPHLGRRAARRAGRAPRRRCRAACWRPSGARASRATTRPRPRRRWPSTTSAASCGSRRSASRSWSGSRTSPTSAASARASGSTRAAARSSCPRRCRCSRTSACA